MEAIVRLLEVFFQNIPLSLLEVWGSFGFIIGLCLMVFAYGGFTFRTAGKWTFGREWQAWDGKSLLSIGITFVLIFVTGYIGSFFVLVPGAQTFESLKDLSVFLCIVLFGYPALLAVPFAYGLTDLYEGVPPEFLLDWITGYFINPACFWIAYQFIGINPDFRLKRTWGYYLLFVLIFMSIEPQLWGYICADKFTSKISYTIITPALFFTTAITWMIAPFVMLGAYPLAKKLGLFWAEIPSHVKQRVIGFNGWVWESGPKRERDDISDPKSGLPIRLFLLIPFILVTFIIVSMTASFVFNNAERGARNLARSLHLQISENLKLKLDHYFTQNKASEVSGIEKILNELAISKNGRVFIIDRSGKLIATSLPIRKGKIVEGALKGLRQFPQGIEGVTKPVVYQFELINTKPLSRETWLTLATPYKSDWIITTVLPESFYLQGAQQGNSQSAMIFAFAILSVLLVAAVLAAMVIRPIQKICHATMAIAENDYSQRVPSSRLRELNTLAVTFNSMADQLQSSMESLVREVEEKNISENRLQLAIKAANLGIWEWIIPTDELIWNEQMYSQYGLDSKVSKTKYETWLNCIAAEDQKRMIAEVLAALKGEKEFDTEFKILRKDGSVRSIRAHSKTLRNDMGRAIRMVGVNFDITDKKKAEQEIEHYRNHLEDIVQQRTEELLSKMEQVKQLTEKQAKAEIYEKFAQIFLSLRDNANSPLQVQTLVVAMLKKYCPERIDIINHLESSVESLSNMNKILTRLESRITMTSTTLMSEQEILDFLDKFEHKS